MSPEGVAADKSEAAISHDDRLGILKLELDETL
jgi:hypothetical protein